MPKGRGNRTAVTPPAAPATAAPGAPGSPSLTTPAAPAAPALGAFGGGAAQAATTAAGAIGGALSQAGRALGGVFGGLGGQDIRRGGAPDARTPSAAPPVQPPAPPPETSAPPSPTRVPDTPSLSPEDLQRLALQVVNHEAVPNPLNSFHQVAYHWKLFMANDDDLYTRTGKPATVNELYKTIDDDARVRKIIVAETGVTSYNIKSVEIRSLVGPTFEGRNTGPVKFTISIVEPLSVGFLDVLKETALALRVRNLQKCPYYLELSFRAYDEATGAIQQDPLRDAGLEASRWIWQVQLVDIDTHFDSSGGQYTITAQVYNDGALDTDILTAPQNTNVSGKTIGEVLESLGQRMTRSWKLRYGNELVTFAFLMHKIPEECHPPGLTNLDPNTYGMRPQNPNLSAIRVNPMQAGEAMQGQINPGTPWSDIINWILGNNDQTQALGLDEANQRARSHDAGTFREAVLFEIETDIKITGYDILTANYAKQVVVHIWPYYTQALLGGYEQRENARDPQVQARMAARLLELGFLRKHYDYLYTGLNTEVIEFDIRSSFKWNALLPKLGSETSVDQAEPAARVQPAELAQTSSNSAEAIQRNRARDAEIRDDAISIDDLRIQKDALLEQQKPFDDALKRAQQLRDPTRRPAPTAQDIAEAERLIAENQAKYDDLTRQLVTKSNRQIDLSNRIIALDRAKEADAAQFGGTQASVRYAEELLKPDGTLNSTASEFQYQSFNYSISFRQGYREAVTQSGTGFLGQYHRDKSVFGSLIDQMYQPYTLQLANVDLTIRGDPYWIGATNLQRQVLLRAGAENADHVAPGDARAGLQNKMAGIPNFVAGDQTFLVTFRFPVLIGDDNNPVFKQNDTFNGIYRATEVLSTFADGKFTQKLHGIILPLINVAAAFGNIRSLPTGGGSAGNPTASGASPTPGGGAAASPGPVTPAITRPEQQRNAVAFRDALVTRMAAQGTPITEAQADGIIANAYRESSMNPAAHGTDTNRQPVGGLLQWNGPRYRAFQQFTGKLPQDATIEEQAAFAAHELAGSERGAYAALRRASTPEEAAQAWIKEYERPADTTGGQSTNRTFLGRLYGSAGR